ncbi:MAG: Fic family protein [Mobilitalea sp.]
MSEKIQINRVPHLIKELVDWAKKADIHPLIKSCAFHYEFEFIHPFADGNGRMGRMWQTLLLYKWKSLFGWLPIETLIRERQEEYYKVLGECDHSANSSKFIEFILATVYDALREIADTEQVTEQVEKLLSFMKDKEYSTREMMELLGLKHRPSFRDNYLLPGIKLGYMEMLYSINLIEMENP